MALFSSMMVHIEFRGGMTGMGGKRKIAGETDFYIGRIQIEGRAYGSESSAVLSGTAWGGADA